MYDCRATLEMWELSHFVFTQEQHSRETSYTELTLFTQRKFEIAHSLRNSDRLRHAV